MRETGDRETYVKPKWNLETSCNKDPVFNGNILTEHHMHLIPFMIMKI